MANFNEAEHLTGINEGGYSNNQSDHGGETYAGISRNNWPNWQGWYHIDSIKNIHGTDDGTINQWAKQDLILQSLVYSFYKTNFWDVNKLDQLNDQQLADSCYDFGVNSGTIKAAKMIQEASNVISDSIIGQKTIVAINTSKQPDLYNRYNSLREEFYRKLATHPHQAQFLNSWLSRLKPYKS
jgi:lysozyme family protein